MTSPIGSSSPELTELLELADRPRAQGWSFAASLTRYAQPRPELSVAIWRELRRVLWSLREGSDRLEADGPELLTRARDEGSARPASSGDQDDLLVAVLRGALELDALADVLVAWAAERAVERPDAQVEAMVHEVAQLLDEAGVPHEPRGGPPRGRGGRGV